MAEHLETPERYRRFLEHYGGLNIRGEANFILQWGANPVRRYAVPDAFLGPYMNCWVLAEWNAPEEFGAPEDIEALGIPFPREGAYLPLVAYRDGKEPLMLDSDGLNLDVLKATLHIVLNHKHDSLQKRYGFLKDQFDKGEAAKTQLLIDRIKDGAAGVHGCGEFSRSTKC